MFEIPHDVLKAAQFRGELDEVMEYRLSTADVALMLGKGPNTIRIWATEGKEGAILRSRQFGTGKRRPRRAYRLSDVRWFANLFRIPIDYDMIHPTLQAEWKVGSHGTRPEK